MDVSLGEFWKLATRSRILTAEDCQQLEAEFAGVRGASGQGNAATLGQWLVARGTLTEFQVKTLLAGRPGPFIYGDYCVYDRIRSKEGRLANRFRAVHLPTRHPVLLHFFTDPSVREPQVWNALLPQIAWACWVGSPYVCQCYQTVDLGKIKLVAIENLVGDTLAAHLAGGMRLGPADACRLVREAALGLAQMHQLGQVHGQLQPANFWLESTGTLKLLQFPLAGDVAAGPGPIDWSAPDPEGKLLATADYAAPELAQPGRAADPLTDIYALGAVLYQALSGWPPFPGGDVASKLARHAGEPVSLLAAAGVPEPLAQVVAYLLSKDPGQRYQHAAQVAEALAYFVDPAMLNSLPATLPTAPALDAWLEQQTRVPGMAPGSIPTATQWAAHSSAQYSAAQQQTAKFEAAQQAAYAAQQQAAYEQAAAQQYAAEQAAAQQLAAQQPAAQQAAAGFAPGYAPGFSGFAADPPANYAQPDYAAPPAPSENGGGFFESLDHPREQFDPLAHIPVRDDRPQYADLTAGAPSAHATDPYAAGGFGFAAPAVAEPPVVAPAPDYGYQAAAAVETYAQPAAAAPQKAGLDVSSLVDSPSSAKSASTVRKSARKKNDTVTLAIFGGVAAVLLLVGGIIISRALNSSGSGADTNTNIADNGGDTKPHPPPGGDTSPNKLVTVNPPTNSGDKAGPKPPPNSGPPDGHSVDTKAPPSGSSDTGTPKVKVEKIADDGATLWASPTAGEPMPLAYIASGPQVILSVRPRQILTRPDADQLLPAVGPWGDMAQAALKQITGFDLNQIDRVIATMNDSGTGQLVPTFVIRTPDKMSAEALLAGWGNPTAAKEGTESYYKGATWSFYLPPNEGGKVLVVAPEAQIKDVIGAAGAPPTMSRYIEAIAPNADGDRDVNLLIAPSYLLTDGKSFFSGPLAPLQNPFASFFGDDARGGAGEPPLRRKLLRRIARAGGRRQGPRQSFGSVRQPRAVDFHQRRKQPRRTESASLRPQASAAVSRMDANRRRLHAQRSGRRAGGAALLSAERGRP